MNGMFTWKYGPDFDEDAGGAGGSGSSAGSGVSGKGGEGETLTFETWLGTQDEKVKTLLDGHTKGLKTALDSERESRKDLEKKLRDLAKKAEQGSDAEKQLTEMADQIEAADRKADFYEEAHKAGVTNLKLAYIVATQDDLFDKKGQVNFVTMKESYSELFGSPAKTKGNAGNGTNQSQQPKENMNTFIRRAAGRE